MPEKKRFVPKLAVATMAALVCAAAASTASPAAPGMLKGIYDNTQLLYGNPDVNFALLDRLRAKAVRMDLYWGGQFGVANRRPAQPTNPDDPAYDWGIYDRAVSYAAQYGIQVVFSIWGTPGWANNFRGIRYAPSRPADLQAFAYAAARRYSGSWQITETVANPDPAAEPGSTIERERTLPRVRYWLAWNEPNNPAFLLPQYRLVRGKPVVWSGREYAKICNAVYSGIKLTLSRIPKVACGVTAPRGNNNPRTLRPSVAPIPFIRAMRAAGVRRMDAYAHHPYHRDRREAPTKKPPKGSNAVTLANLDVLVKEVTRRWGAKRIWITEYGWETPPERRVFSVPNATQARYLTQAFTVARRHRRVDMMLWFMLRDDRNISLGWQSGLMTLRGGRKPAFTAFQRVP